MGRDVDLAEECTRHAYAAALRSWPTSGVPDRPGAGLAALAPLAAVPALATYSYLSAASADFLADRLAEVEREADHVNPDARGASLSRCAEMGP